MFIENKAEAERFNDLYNDYLELVHLKKEEIVDAVLRFNVELVIYDEMEAYREWDDPLF